MPEGILQIGVGIEVAASEDAEGAPYPCVAAPYRAGVERAVRLAEREFFV